MSEVAIGIEALRGVDGRSMSKKSQTFGGVQSKGSSPGARESRG